ncbi:MAG TPA: aldo/keto reductase, partial [Chloroflexota bacterium]
ATEQSLRNLGLETIDVLQFHRWSNDWVGQGDWLEAIQQLKQQGKIRFPLDQLPAVALRYTLSNPAVSTIIPGMRSVRHVAANRAVGDGKGLPPEQVQRLKAHRWVRNFYGD